MDCPLVMHTRVLPPPSTPQWDILLVATLIHAALSIAYALIPARLAGRLRTWPALFAGAPYGLAVYVANPYGIAVRLPRFAVARDWVTVVAHLISGVALAGGCRLFAQGSTEPKVEATRRCAMHEGTTARRCHRSGGSDPRGDSRNPYRAGAAGTHRPPSWQLMNVFIILGLSRRVDE